jgi:hypothetical protein
MTWPLKTCLACLIALLGVADAPAQQFEDERRLTEALGALRPQRPGIVDAYVVVAALDADPVFGREARETGRVLANRFDAEGRFHRRRGGRNYGPGRCERRHELSRKAGL